MVHVNTKLKSVVPSGLNFDSSRQLFKICPDRILPVARASRPPGEGHLVLPITVRASYGQFIK